MAQRTTVHGDVLAAGVVTAGGHALAHALAAVISVAGRA